MTRTTNTAAALDRPTFYIDGQSVTPRGTDSYHVLEAATGNPLGLAALGSAEDIDAAVRSARTAFDHGPWSRTSAAERAAAMRRFGDALATRIETTSHLVSQENGMPITMSAAFNGTAPAGLMHMYADIIENYPLEEVRQSLAGATIVRREPIGVVGAITPWNYPQAIAVFKIAPALAAGCTVVLKASPETALDAYVFAEAAEEAGLPAGVLNIIPAGRDASWSLVQHELVDKIAFTGSTTAGRLIGAECGRLLRPCTLELGGKSASIVLDDADLTTFTTGLAGASFMNNSQTCTTQSRILAPRSRYEEVVDAVRDFARALTVGNPLDPAVTCGPMATRTQKERVMGYIDIAKATNARLVTGGGTPRGMDQGWFVEPTVFADVDNRDRLAQEEVFGPVIAVIPYDDDDDAVRIANESQYGLAGSVWTSDENRGIDIARRIRTGTIGVNYYDIDLGSPFGGMKHSGIGRELGPEAISHYLEYKSIYTSADQLPRS